MRVIAIAILAFACANEPSDKPAQAGPVPVVSVVPAAGERSARTYGGGGSFAYLDSSGMQLLALDSLPDPSAIQGALCSAGKTLPVRYDRLQARKDTDDGRHLAYNFANQAGHVFRVDGEKAEVNLTCYLSPDSTLLANARGATMREPSQCSPQHASRVAAAKARKVDRCWRIASTPRNLEVLVIQFARIDTNALASLALIGDSSAWFEDFPAVYDETSTWRVDDGGEFSPTAFRILFIAALPQSFAIAFSWAGAEGESAKLLITDSSRAFRTLATAYRYWSPA